jgi:two-component system, OmpR family, sensor histidine kinase KdpD
MSPFFPGSSVPVAPERFFTKENLDVLREMALLQVVEEVEAHRLAADVLGPEERLISNAAAEREHRVLGLVRPNPTANLIIRRAWEISERRAGQLELLWVAPPGPDDDLELNRRVDDLRRLAALFGTRLIIERDRDIARAVARVLKRSGSTHVVMGVPHPRVRFGRPRHSLVDEIVVSAPSLQLALVGDPVPPSGPSRANPSSAGPVEEGEQTGAAKQSSQAPRRRSNQAP